MRHAEAARLAAHVMDLLAPACERIEVAGSIRRGQAEVKDIEIVAIGKPPGKPSWDNPAAMTPPLDRLLADLIRYDELGWDEVTKRRGPKYKRLTVHSGQHRAWIAVDLFLCTADTWGNIFTIRTGDADFSRLLVTRRSNGGLMPDDMHQADGYLWRNRTGERLLCPSEAAFFGYLGVDTVPAPAARTEALIAQLRQHAMRRTA